MATQAGPARSPAPDPAAALHAEVRTAFAEAARRCGVARHDLAVAGVPVRLRIAGPALERALLPALAPLDRVVAAAGPTVLLLDGAAAGLAPPALPSGPQAAVNRGVVAGLDTPTRRTAVGLSASMLACVDLAEQSAVVWCGAVDRLPWWERAAPLRTVLHWLLARHGLQLLHAGAVGVDGAGALIAGSGGCGKSTLAMACAAGGLRYLADDYLVVTGDPPVAHALYGTGKLDGASTRRVPGLDGAVLAGPAEAGGKAVYDLHAAAGVRTARRLPLRAVVLPRVRPGLREPRLLPAAPADALRALGPSTVLQLPYEDAAAWAACSRIARRLPAWWLEMGDDVAGAPGLVAGLLEGLRG